MSISTLSSAWRASEHHTAFRFGREAAGSADDAPAPTGSAWSVQWDLRRNCSLAPSQMLWFYASLCGLTLGIAAVFWLQGATLVFPFAGIELGAVGVAMLIYARHAADRESIALSCDELTVEHTSGGHVERVAFQPAWVRVEPRHGDRSLIELSGQGRRITVGRFVRPELRLQLAEELRWALRRWQHRSGRTAP